MAQVEIQTRTHLTFMSWKAIFAGLFVSFLTALTLLALGIGIGGIALSDLEGMAEFGWGAAVWIILTVAISLFVGSYIASRVSNFLSREVGLAQGVTIAALFFAISMLEGGIFLGYMGNAIGEVTKGVANISTSDKAAQAYRNSGVRGVINQEIREMGIAPDRVDDVITGVLSRLLDGDTEGAERVIVTNATVDPQTATQRINTIQATVTAYARDAAQKAARGFSIAGWSLFFLLLISTGASAYGGIAGSKANVKHSLEEDEMLRVA